MFQYSVAISPPDAVIQQIKKLKQKLQAIIGWYSSANAPAHITFNLFQSDACPDLRWETYIDRFALQQPPVSLRFDRTGSFENGAFFLAPDEPSRQLLVNLMKRFHRMSPLSRYQSTTPHISIGRRLTSNQLSVARLLIREVDIQFICRDIVLRRFNESRKQYDLYQRFPFGQNG